MHINNMQTDLHARRRVLHPKFPPRVIVYGCRSSAFLYRLWRFDVAGGGGGGRQLEDIIVGLEQWESVYKWIHNRFPLKCVFPVT